MFSYRDGISLNYIVYHVIYASVTAWQVVSVLIQFTTYSFNVSSITDESTGHFVINFANSLANSNYAIVATATNYTNDDTIAPVGVDASTAYTNSDTGTVDLKTTTQVRIGCAGGSTAYDAYNIYAVVFGD